MTGTKKIAALIIAMAAIAAVSYAGVAYTATSTVPGSNSGEGTAVVGNYVVSNIDYTFANDTTAYNITQVTFSLDTAPPATAQARIRLNGTVYSCTLAGVNATCATTAPQAVVNAGPTLVIYVAD